MDSTGSDDEWDWTFSPRADDQFAQLDGTSQERIVSKLDEVVASEWRSPEDYLDPVRNSPFQKLRVGDYRLGCRILRDERLLRVESIRKREGAYKADD
jgi:mRNA-degrading endonuclease RelE of RelBE toxin-antitoxin system